MEGACGADSVSGQGTVHKRRKYRHRREWSDGAVFVERGNIERNTRN